MSAISVSPTAITLYPPAAVASLSLGLATSVQFSGFAQKSDGSHGGLSFVDRSNGALVVALDGEVSVSASASPGLFYVRAEAQDDPGMYQDIPVTVGNTAELDT
ncbi:MAG: hypothetical protein KGR26_07960, partial [Cyanobacteria bacterium REEB65]|nr:hypothetical protein [Cyanobacteria bacterium REEB65]